MSADRPQRAWRTIAGVVLVALATLIALTGIAEGSARLLFRASATSTMACLVVDDPLTGVRGVPRSDCRQKIFESPLVEYRFNECGFRTPQPCRTAPAGTFRIVLIGSSIAYGMHVVQPLSFAGQLGAMLSARAGMPVDVFNEAMQWGMPGSVALRTDAILRPHPKMILWALTPFDIENVRLLLPFIPGVQPQVSLPPVTPPPAQATGQSTVPAAAAVASYPARAWARLIGHLSDTRTVFMFQHLLYRSQSQYLAHTLTQGEEVDYLRTPPSPALSDNLAIFARTFDQVAAHARAAGVPLVVTLLPSRPQAIMLSNRAWDKGYDPDQLGRLLRPIVEARGARYVDMTPRLEGMPDAGQLYFSVDEHLPPKGHRMLATLLANALARSGALASAGERAR